MAEAELAGVLNEMPSLGFLHSLHRQMAALTTSLEGIELLAGDVEEEKE